ncbi:3beta-hydroxysteroid-4alpha-carboxylate 3-dehydrogenase [Sarracenia purpurea var. burkii]
MSLVLRCYLESTVEGSSVVFYEETTFSSTHDFYVCYTPVVQGPKDVINACRHCKVKWQIYNSSVDVVNDSLQDIHSGDEFLPYASKFDNMLGDLKLQAEAQVLFANDVDGLLKCAIRPSIVFGTGDTEIIPFLANQAKSGWAKV